MTDKPSINELILKMTGAARLCDEAQQALDELYGIQFVDGYTTRLYQEPRITIHVYRGIDDIIEALGIEPEDKPKNPGSAPERTVQIDGVGLFQLGTETGYYYKRAKEHEV